MEDAVNVKVFKESGGELVDTVVRVPKQHSGWQSVLYKGKRYQLFGGPFSRADDSSYRINLALPPRSRK